MENHGRCKQKVTPLPRRVIDVGCLGNQNVSLLQTQRQPGMYIALSHCWGPVELQPLRTLTSNIEDLSIQIPWYKLNKTFRDAIWLTQSLGVRYVWIDSLCIIQDDEGDWQEQSAEMSEVYGGSYLTIAATRAANGNCGLFYSPLNQHEIQPNVTMRGSHDHFLWNDTQYALKDDKQNNPLLFRGWCFQERLLTQRVLHFSSHEMVFECNTVSKSECGTLMTANETSRDRTFKAYFHERDDSESWDIIVENYCASDLTHSTDLLIAFSGISKMFAIRTGKTYLGGLWLEDLPAGLLWYSLDSVMCARISSYTAPTFSWGSRIGPVSLLNHAPEEYSKEYLLEIMDWECAYEGVNAYGTVAAAHLKVLGILLPSIIKETEAVSRPLSHPLRNHHQQVFAVQICADSILMVNLEPIPSTTHQQLTSEWFCLDTKEDRKYVEMNEQRFYCAVISADFCLVMAQNQDRTYRRVGLAFFGGWLKWTRSLPKTEFILI